MNRVSLAAIAFSAALALPPPASAAERSPFDGTWEVTLTCPPHHEEDDDAKGYVHRFPAEIKEGMLRAVHGNEGEPSYHLLTGPIGADGAAALVLEGIVNNPAYSVNNAQRGKPYSYRVRARFEPDSGTGQRIGKRKCNFLFKRR
jgi:hypothetical protein